MHHGASRSIVGGSRRARRKVHGDAGELKRVEGRLAVALARSADGRLLAAEEREEVAERDAARHVKPEGEREPGTDHDGTGGAPG